MDSQKKTPRAILVIAACVVAYLALIVYNIAPYDFNPSAMTRFGVAHPFYHPSALESNLIVFDDPQSGGVGYDGQFYYYIIKDYFMGDDGVPNPFREQRIVYPLLAYLLAFGQAGLLSYSMPAVNLLAIAISAFLLWRMFGDGGARPETLSLYMLNIGFLVAVFFNVATPLCVGFAVAGVYFYFEEKIWLAALALALGALTQETIVLVTGSLGLWLLWRKSWREAFAIAMSMAPWALWQAALWSKYGSVPMSMSGGHFSPPFVGMVSQLFSLDLPGGVIGNLRELSVYPFMLFILALLAVGIWEMKKKASFLNLLLIVHGLAGICFNSEQIWGSTITSPARTLATVFPFIALCHARSKSTGLRLLIIACVILTLMGLLRILILPTHPFFVT